MSAKALIDKVKSWVEKIPSQATVLVAVSGGIDSMTLLHIITHFTKINVAVAHVNYHLRGEQSMLDQKLIEKYCEDYQIPLHILDAKLDKNSSGIQEQARTIRYQFFDTLQQKHGYYKTALAHHKDDLIETQMHHLFRGTGTKGLDLTQRKSKFERPFSNATQEEINQYQETYNVAYREDQSNFQNAYSRNLIRNRIFPILDEAYPNIKQRIERSFSNIIEDYHLLKFLIENYISSNLKDYKYYQSLPLSTHSDLILYHYFDGLLSLQEWSDFIKQASANPIIKGGFTFYAWGGKLLWYKQNEQLTKEIHIHDEGVYQLMHLKFSISLTTKAELPSPPHVTYIPFIEKPFPITIRKWKHGDQFKPFGMQGKHKKVQDLFSDFKLNPIEKQFTPILEKGGEILGIIGLRMSEETRIDQYHKQFIRIKWE